MNEEIKRTCSVLLKGGLILYPTDTIWGIGCDATNPAAVQRIYEIKQREDAKSMLVLIDSSARLDYYLSEYPDIALDLIDLSDKPLTIIYPGARNLAANLLADDGSIGIRVAKEPFSHQLCRQFKRAIVSTSANISGQASPSNYSQISSEIINAVDYIVDYKRDDISVGKPSSIIKLGPKGEVSIIRS
ncbi:threonylcarbamoyl-AMP synthase [Bacteroidales bacterium]|nr:threonylcarbamoyl-AMP synthase [Bacteroidales bacterium]